VTSWLLDTNILSDLVRNPQGRTAQRIDSIADTQICTSIIVACEARYGAAKRGSAKLTAQLETILQAINVVPLDEGVDRHYASVRHDLERRGLPISANDMLIAAHALALDCTLVTDNLSEFQRVKGLALENWLR
jgi:tRNA(fMet)-specific endonuclease VapC